MEGMDEGAESQAVKPKTERPPTKVTEVDHGLPIERCNLLEIQAKLASSESEWIEEPSPLRSLLRINKVGLLPGFPLVFARIFDRSKDEQCNPWSTSGEVFPMRNKGMMVEELTLKNYKSCNVSYSDRGFNTEPAVACEIGQAHSIRLQWEHLPEKLGEGNISSHSQLTCKDGTLIDLNDGLPSKQSHHDSDKEKSKNVRVDNSWEQTPVLVQNPEHAMASRDLVHSDRYHHLNGPPSMPMLGGGLRTTISSSSSGFPEFFKRNTSRGKGTSFRGAAPVQNSSAAVKPALGRNVLVSANNVKTDLMRAYFTLSGGSYSDCTHDSINLRDWIFPGCQSLNKPERYLILSQILELVDLAHSQGVFIKDLRPSSFIIFSNNQVKYVGSSSFHIPSSNSDNNKDYMNSSVDGSLKRRRQQLEPFFFGPNFKCASYSENVFHSDGTPPIMHKKFGDALELCDHNRSLPFLLKPESTADMSTSSRVASHSKYGLVVHENEFEDHDTGKCIGMGLPSPCPQQFSLNDRQLEERWYVSPEEINGKACSSASNIYSLGVLLFELFCCSESWEVHASSMSDLRHRILPPSFLVENPKEAGFCLWLLHPEPLFRPKAREVLQSDLILQSLKLSTDKHSTPFLDEDYADSELLLHFLGTLKEQKHIHASKLVEDIGCLEEDMKEVEIRQSLRNNKIFQKISEEVTACKKLKIQGNNFIERTTLAGKNKSSLSTNSYGPSGSPVRCSSEARMSKHMKQLEDAYFSMRSKLKLSGSDNPAREGRGVLRNHRKHFPMLGAEGSQNSVKDDPRGMFFDGFCKYARYNRFEVRGVLRNGDIVSSPNVICSLSFDRDEEYFVAAGVSKKIKIFEFQSLLNDTVDIHYPAIEMSSKSKLSCVCWNNYIKNFLASTDYDGTVQLWDATTGQGFTQYVEHQKRAWSVDFSLTDPTKISSGSDDCSVKLWSINEKNSVGTIRNHANVCCVQFSPYSRHLLAFGSADYKVFCYDLRNIRVPWCAFAGHGKAVSYVKFLDGKTVVSASTDNTLKLWDLNKNNSCDVSTSACILTMNGHTNEKNFVGLSVSDGYIACGSETNEVYAYYKSLPMPIASYKFGSIDSMSGQGKVEDNGLFVSSVCWKGKSNMAIAANSDGNIKLLQLI